MTKTKSLVLTGIFIALSFLGSNIRLPGVTIALDSLPGFLGALILGPVYGAIIGFIGHLFTAMLSGFYLGIPLHVVIAVSMAITMFGFGFTFKLLDGKMRLPVNLGITGVVGVILNAPVSLAMSITALTVMVGREAGFGLMVLFPALLLGAVINVALVIMLYIALYGVWVKFR